MQGYNEVKGVKIIKNEEIEYSLVNNIDNDTIPFLDLEEKSI